MKPEHRLAVVAFGERAAVEQSPQQGAFSGFTAQVGPDQSRLAEGLELALGLLPAGEPGRVLVPGDGYWTGRDPLESLAMRWKSANLLEAELPLSGAETLVASVVIDGFSPVAMPPACLKYSPEYAPRELGGERPALLLFAVLLFVLEIVERIVQNRNHLRNHKGFPSGSKRHSSPLMDPSSTL